MDLMQLERLFWSTARGRLDARAVAAAFVSDARLEAVARMAIYRDMYFARQQVALAEAFPRVAARLGESPFRELAREYVLAHPSQAPALEGVGERFADFLQARTTDVDGDLVDLARLEWLACSAQLAPEEPRADPTRVPPGRWPDVRLRLCRSLASVVVARSAYVSWTGDRVAGNGALCVAVFRAGFRVRHLVLSDDEARALRLADQGRTLAEICAALPDVARAHEVMAGWLSRGWVTALSVD
jgi:hypothetical protein